MLPVPNAEPHQARKRLRTKAACEACKLRKRKCNGESPCQACIRYNYECQYSAVAESRNRSARTTERQNTGLSASFNAQTLSSALPPETSTRDHAIESPKPKLGESEIEANAGLLFPIILGRKLDSHDGSINAARGCAWNLGLRERDQDDSQGSIISILSQDEWEELVDVYTTKIHPVYGFLDLDTLSSLGIWRWGDESATSFYDSVMCGIAALACLFSPSSISNSQYRENSLVQCAKDLLEMASTAMDPSYHDIEAWFLRTLYLRCNSSPLAAWMASCTTVHLAEIFGLHREDTYTETQSRQAPSVFAKPKIPRRKELFWFVTVLNSWISVECGRPRINLQGPVTCTPPPRRREELDNSTQGTEYLLLAPITEIVFDEVGHPIKLRKALEDLESLVFENEAPVLSQTVTSFTLYRRLRLIRADIDAATNHIVIRLGSAGLGAVRAAIDSYCPWWHILNVPLQFVCVLLAMDTDYAYSRLEEALRVVELASARFPTRKTKLTYETAERLVRLAQKRKAADASYLGNLVYGFGGASRTTIGDPDIGNSAQGSGNELGDMDAAGPGLDSFMFEIDPLLDFTLGPFTASAGRSEATFLDFDSRQV